MSKAQKKNYFSSSILIFCIVLKLRRDMHKRIWMGLMIFWIVRNIYLVIQMSKYICLIYLDFIHNSCLTAPKTIGISWWEWQRYLGLPSGSAVKNLPATQETWVQSLGQEDPLKEGMEGWRKEQIWWLEDCYFLSYSLISKELGWGIELNQSSVVND